MTENQLRKIFIKTKGHCHFCGNKLVFEKRGWQNGSMAGFWEVDHVIQLDKGGKQSSENCLPACTRCNRLRWHRKGKNIRELLFLGLIARDQIKNKKSKIGSALRQLRTTRIEQNKRRRKGKR